MPHTKKSTTGRAGRRKAQLATREDEHSSKSRTKELALFIAFL